MQNYELLPFVAPSGDIGNLRPSNEFVRPFRRNYSIHINRELRLAVEKSLPNGERTKPKEGHAQPSDIRRGFRRKAPSW